jgi:hypothetical protein
MLVADSCKAINLLHFPTGRVHIAAGRVKILRLLTLVNLILTLENFG